MKTIQNTFALLTLILFSFTTANAQIERCGATEILLSQNSNNPEIEQRRAQLEKDISTYLDNKKNKNDKEGNDEEEGTYTIPVVLHLLYTGTTDSISDAQLLSQLDVLNEDFSRSNADADNYWGDLGADTKIQFCLARRDPYGHPTNGITYTETSTSIFTLSSENAKYDDQGGKNPWPTDEYLNIWVVPEIADDVLGYAQFPGGDQRTDGVVVWHKAFGNTGTLHPSYNLGRTTTHEVGHWINLKHIWGNVTGCIFGDNVSDTPKAHSPNYGCNIGNVSCSSEDMVQNYMDYSDDACMNLFTEGQAERMRACFIEDDHREKLITSNACVDVLGCKELLIDFEDFEDGLGIWQDGGSDAELYEDETYAASGSHTIRLRDNSGTSNITTSNLNVQGHNTMNVFFAFYTEGFNNEGHDFFLELSVDGGDNFSMVEEWNYDGEFVNDSLYNYVCTIVYGEFSEETQLRIRCDASNNSDKVYIDDITIYACTSVLCDDLAPTTVPFSLEVGCGNGLLALPYVCCKNSTVTVYNPNCNDGNAHIFDLVEVHDDGSEEIVFSSYDWNDDCKITFNHYFDICSTYKAIHNAIGECEWYISTKNIGNCCKLEPEHEFEPIDNITEDDDGISFRNFPQEEVEFKIMPNPATDKVQIQHTDIIDQMITIYNVAGKELRRIRTVGDLTQIDVTTLRAGTYLVRLESKGLEPLVKRLLILK
jgi:hypothetical protein